MRKEARAAAQLSHPGICTVYALEDVGGELFIASEFIDGPTLRDEIQSGVRPSSTIVAEAASELSQALAAAHAKGIMHRDLKPENVMRARDGRLKILDFGLARVLDEPAGGASMATQAGRTVRHARLYGAGAAHGAPCGRAKRSVLLRRRDARVRVRCASLSGADARGDDGPSPRRNARSARRAATRPRLVCPRCDRAMSSKSAVRPIPDRPATSSRRLRRTYRRLADDAAAWWRTHQLVIFTLYIVVVYVRLADQGMAPRPVHGAVSSARRVRDGRRRLSRPSRVHRARQSRVVRTRTHAGTARS